MNMQPNDDEKFESFLKQFRPRAPEPLRMERQWIFRSPLRFAFGTAAAVLVTAVLVIHFLPKRVPTHEGAQDVANVERFTHFEPLTIAKANALLAQAPSVKAAVDDMAFKPQSTQLSQGKHSALEVLSQENMRL
jgi:hypothetical protein